jgi:hypothetical protein
VHYVQRAEINFLRPGCTVENVAFSNCAIYNDRHPKDSGNTRFWPELQDFRAMCGIHLDTPAEVTQVSGVTISNITIDDVRLPFLSALGTAGRPRLTLPSATARSGM